MIAICCAAVVAVVGYFIGARKHPENTAGHGETDRTGSAMIHGDVHGRPAGPGAEDEFVVDRGQTAPGPSAESVSSTQDRRAGPDDRPLST